MRLIVLLLCGLAFVVWPRASRNPEELRLSADNAIVEGDLATLKAAVSDGLDVNLSTPAGNTLLMQAAWTGRADVVRWLVCRSADPTRRTTTGWTALMMASVRGHDDAVLALLAAGASADAVNQCGMTAQALARHSGFDEIAMMLTPATRPTLGIASVHLGIEPVE